MLHLAARAKLTGTVRPAVVKCFGLNIEQCGGSTEFAVLALVVGFGLAV